MLTVRLGEAPKIWWKGKVSCSGSAGGVLANVASPHRPGELSESFFWLTLGVALDLGKVVRFASSLGMPLASKESNIARNVYCLFRLNPDEI